MKKTYKKLNSIFNFYYFKSLMYISFLYKKIYKTNKLLFVVLLLLILFIFIRLYNYIFNDVNSYDNDSSNKNVKEGLAVIDDIKDAFNELGKIKDFAEKIPNAVSSIKDEVINTTNIVTDSVNQIDNKLIYFSEKIKSSTVDVIGEEIKKMDDRVLGLIDETKKYTVDIVGDEVQKIDDKIVNVVDDVKKNTIDVVEKEVKKLDDKFLDIIEKVKQYTIDLVTEKIYSLLRQIGNIFKNALIDPIVILFKGIGNIFVGIFGILREISNKIISLPNCILPYIIFSITSSIKSIYLYIIPEFIINIIYTIHSYTLKYITDRLYVLLGIDSYNSCYHFGVTDEINKIEQSAKNIGDAFSNDFGRLDFSKINI